MKLRAKVGTHSSAFVEADGRSLGKQRPIPIGKRIRIKYEWGKWQDAIVEKVLIEDDPKNNLHFLALV